MFDNSGSGAIIQLVASVIYPAGITLDQFSDDTDAFDVPSINIVDSAMGVNGDLITWSKPQPLKLTLSVIAESPNDQYLQVLFDANRIARNKISTNDVITLSLIYQAGNTVTFSQGRITDGMPATGIASSARFKTKVYGFVFENKVST